MPIETSRRRFLQTASLAAAALPITERALEAQSAPPGTSERFKLIPASDLRTTFSGLTAKPGNANLFEAPSLPFTAVLTVEQGKAAKEFEWHEGRDHLLQVVEGSTVYELGGTPEGGHSAKPGEWLAPASGGATRITLGKGDWLLIPRNTPHKRITDGSVSFVLLSATGPAGR